MCLIMSSEKMMTKFLLHVGMFTTKILGEIRVGEGGGQEPENYMLVCESEVQERKFYIF